MILHQQIFHPFNAPREPWLALHCESLTLALCEQRGSLVCITPSVKSPGRFTNTESTQCLEVAKHVSDDIRGQIPGSMTRIHAPATDLSTLCDVPEYVLVNSLDGKTPGVFHSHNPKALYLADPKAASLRPAERFDSDVDLSVEGWAYWWEDAQRAFHKHTVAFMKECGLPVPSPILDAVRHL